MAQLAEWPAVVTCGRTIEEAREMLLDAAREMVASYRDEGREPPIGGGHVEPLTISLAAGRAASASATCATTAACCCGRARITRSGGTPTVTSESRFPATARSQSAQRGRSAVSSRSHHPPAHARHKSRADRGLSHDGATAGDAGWRIAPDEDQPPAARSRLSSKHSGVVASVPGGSFGATWPSNQVCHASRDSHTSMTRYPELAAPLR